MVMPDGQERWAVQKYTSITPKSNFKFFNAFSDENENLQLPGSDWTLTSPRAAIKRPSTSRSTTNPLSEWSGIMADGGFQKGTEAQLQNLEELLNKLSQQTGRASE